MVDAAQRPASYAGLEAAPENMVAEIIDGDLVTRRHGYVAPAMMRTVLGYALRDVTRRRSIPDAPWQILMLPEVHLGRDVVVPELAAWSVERLPFLLDEHTDVPPDWVCELTHTETNCNPALSRKVDLYRTVGVRFMWLIGLRSRMVEAFELRGGSWTDAGTWSSAESVRAPPFDAISFSLADLWPLDKPLGFHEDPTPYYAGDR